MSSTAADRAAFTPCADDRVIVSRFITMWWDGIRGAGCSKGATGR